MNEALQRANISYESICGVPYTALPISSVSVIIFRDGSIGFICQRSSVRNIKNRC